MGKLRVKLFAPANEEEINRFLEEQGNRIAVVDIRLAAVGGGPPAGFGANPGSARVALLNSAACLILYEEHPDKIGEYRPVQF